MLARVVRVEKKCPGGSFEVPDCEGHAIIEQNIIVAGTGLFMPGVWIVHGIACSNFHILDI